LFDFQVLSVLAILTESQIMFGNEVNLLKTAMNLFIFGK